MMTIAEFIEQQKIKLHFLRDSRSWTTHDEDRRVYHVWLRRSGAEVRVTYITTLAKTIDGVEPTLEEVMDVLIDDAQMWEHTEGDIDKIAAALCISKASEAIETRDGLCDHHAQLLYLLQGDHRLMRIAINDTQPL